VTPELRNLTPVHLIPGHLPSFPGLRSLTETPRIRCHTPGQGHLPSIPETGVHSVHPPDTSERSSYICTCLILGEQVANLSLTKLA
jgi:hypothetical protein